MANFDDQVMGMTGLTISGASTAPSQAELSTFLKDGVIDVTRRSIAMDPSEATNFSRFSSEQTSNGFNPGTDNIITVMRETGVNGDFRRCRKIPFSLTSRVTDTTSLNYASKYNPVYAITQNRNVHVYPLPGSSNDTYKVLYVNSSPEEGDGTDLQYNSSGIKWFPNDRVYLVVIYAAIKSIESALSEAKALPTVGGESEELTATMTSTTSDTYGTDAEFKDFSSWFTTAGEFIEDEEDQELATMQLSKINSYIQAYTAQNQANVSKQAHLQIRHTILSRQYESAFGVKPKEQS
tara:strand:+ start:689 stop:1570 length:882 start_codon:yes stop_codon:yes gene_type:complete